TKPLRVTETSPKITNALHVAVVVCAAVVVSQTQRARVGARCAQTNLRRLQPAVEVSVLPQVISELHRGNAAMRCILDAIRAVAARRSRVVKTTLLIPHSGHPTRFVVLSRDDPTRRIR